MVGTSIITRAALGRQGQLGDLYNAAKDRFCDKSIFKTPPPDEGILVEDRVPITEIMLLDNLLEDKWTKFKVEPDLQISIILKLTELTSGSGLYIIDNENTQLNCFRKSLFSRTETKFEQFNFIPSDILVYINFDNFDNKEATHVVYGIEWGANTIVTIESIEHDVSNEITEGLQRIQEYISTKNDDDIINILQDCSVKFVSDIAPPIESSPQTIKEIAAFMSNVPSHINTEPGWREKPLVFYLISMEQMRKFLNLNMVNNPPTYVGLSKEIISSYKKHFKELDSVQKEATYLGKASRENTISLKDEYKMDLELLQTEIKDYDIRKRKNIKENILNYRQKLLLNIEHPNPANINNYNNSLTYLKIMSYLCSLPKVICVFGEEQINSHVQNVEEAFILFISRSFYEKHMDLFNENVATFVNLQNRLLNSVNYIVCDLDLHNPNISRETDFKTVCIHHAVDKSGVSKDYYIERKEENGKNIAYCKEYAVYFNTQPKNAIKVELVCPGSLGDKLCAYSTMFWNCKLCKEDLYYGRDKYFYCKCSKGKAKHFVFRCNNRNHSRYLPIQKSILDDFLQKLEYKQMNILVLGETGVGKTTWLNSLINYMTYKSLDDAQENGVKHIIPAKFELIDESGESHIVAIGNPDVAENLETGMSATQYPNTYTYYFDKIKVRFIDTPGIADVRGLEYDRINMQAILDHINYLDVLHGICILLKPGQTRLSPNFNFCINELLRNLHKSATDNIIFCFTNTKGTHFKPTGTLSILKKFLSDNNIDLKLSKEKCYCMDNEGFRYLCSLKNCNITHSEDEILDYHSSWDRSVLEASRIFEYLSSLKQHNVKETVSLNESRKLVLAMAKPITDVAKLITIRVAQIEKEKKEIENAKLEEINLEKLFNSTRIDLITEQMEHAQTVCANETCVEQRVSENNVTLIKYKQICHSPCKARNIEPATLNAESLKYCRALKKRNDCRECGCTWDKHMHLMYKQEWRETIVENKPARENYKKNISIQKQIELSLKDHKAELAEHENELHIIKKVSAQLGAYLKSNAIIPRNDSVETYIKQLIQVEESKSAPTDTDKRVLKGLKSYLKEYRKEIKVLEESKDSIVTAIMSPSAINEIRKKLYGLKWTGAIIENNIKVSEKAVKKSKGYKEVIVDIKSNMSSKVTNVVNSLYDKIN